METQQYKSSKRRENRKTGLKILICIFVTTMISVFGIVLLTSNLSFLVNWYEKMMAVEYKDISYMEDLEQLLYKHETLVFQHMVAADKDTKDSLMAKAYEIQQEINELLVVFDEHMKGRENAELFHTIYSGVGSYFNKIDIIFDFSSGGDVATAEYYMNMTLANNIVQVNDNVEQLKENIELAVREKNEQIEKQVNRTSKMVVLLVVMLLSFAVIEHLLCGKLTKRIVYIDPLTGTANADAMEAYMTRMQKKKRLDQFTEVLINMKDFNYLNRQYGTDVGDALLTAYGQALRAKMQDSEVLSRQSGDTFLALLKKEHAEDFLEYLKAVKVEIPVADVKRSFDLHCRCAVYPIRQEDTAGDALNNVSMTLSIAKRSGNKDQVWFSEKRYKQIMADQEVLELFEKGMKQEEFVVYYQPKVNARTKKLCGCEALVRWFHEGQLVPPGKFIPVLESEGKVVELDFYVFEHVCRDIAEWVKKGIEPVRISSNFSKLHLQNPNLAEDILSIMRKYEIDPKYIELELTESSGYDDLVMLKKFVKQMNEEQVHTSMDDFGTGYSSLSMLKDVDVDVVKLDKSFLNGVDQGDESKEKMISHLIHMIRDLQRTVVCEGVETEKEFEFLKGVDCDMIQGYLFDKPLPHDEFEQRLIHPLYQS